MARQSWPRRCAPPLLLLLDAVLLASPGSLCRSIVNRTPALRLHHCKSLDFLPICADMDLPPPRGVFTVQDELTNLPRAVQHVVESPSRPDTADMPFTCPSSPEKQAARYTADTIPKAVPPTVAGRRNLRNFQSRPPPTDLETWRQAQAALQAGLTTKQLVQREFERNFGPECVRCACLTAMHVCALLRM
jgi:hypothetical protein